MTYVEKTLTKEEKIIETIFLHWIFWFSPTKLLSFISFLSCIIYFIVSLFNQTPTYLDILVLLILIGSALFLLFYFVEYKTTENVITNKRIVFKSGFIQVDTDELINRKIENIQTKQSVLGRIFDYGNLEFTGTGGSMVLFKKIPKPIRAKKEIESILQNTS